MNTLNKIAFTVLLSFFMLACSSTGEETASEETAKVEKVAVTPNDESKLAISGMMCSIGCAGLIESELNSTAGIATAEVAFEDSVATINFDNTIISEDEIIAAIQNLADHQYTASPAQMEQETPAEETAE